MKWVVEVKKEKIGNVEGSGRKHHEQEESKRINADNVKGKED